MKREDAVEDGSQNIEDRRQGIEERRYKIEGRRQKMTIQDRRDNMGDGS